MDELTINAPIGLPKRGAVLVARGVKLDRFGLRTADARSSARLRVDNIPSKTHLTPIEVWASVIAAEATPPGNLRSTYSRALCHLMLRPVSPDCAAAVPAPA